MAADRSDGEKNGLDELSKLVRQVVLSKLAEILKCPKDAISLDQRVVDDLRVDSDDLSFWFIPGVESSLGIDVPNKEWRGVSTVRQVCALLEEHCRRKRG